MSAADFSIGSFVDPNSIANIAADALIVEDSTSAHMQGLRKIPYVFALTRYIHSVIQQNLIWAITYNVVAATLCTGVLREKGMFMTPYVTDSLPLLKICASKLLC